MVQGTIRLFSRDDVQITSATLLDVYRLVLFERLRIARRRARRMVRHLEGVMAVGHVLETRRGQRGRRPCSERGEDLSGEAT